MEDNLDRLVAAVLALCCLATAGFAVYVALKSQVVPLPGLYVDQPNIEFGELSQGEIRTGRFRLTNHFPEPVEILDVLTGCSCAAAVPSEKVLQPKGESVVEVNWSVGLRRGQRSEGVRVYYRTADESRHLSEFTSSATVIPDVEYDSEPLIFEPNLGKTA